MTEKAKMLLKVVTRGPLLSKVAFWKERDELSATRIAILVGSNGSGKTLTIDAIAAHYEAFDKNKSTDRWRTPNEVKYKVGDISIDLVFDKTIKYRGDVVHALPAAALSDEDFFACQMQKRSHGEAALSAFAEFVVKPIKAAPDKSILLLLDEPEAGLSAEAQTLIGRRLHELAVARPSIAIVVATQSDRIRQELMRDGLAEDYDFGGWLVANPFGEKVITP
jgi:predicted ATPase